MNDDDNDDQYDRRHEIGPFGKSRSNSISVQCAVPPL